MTNLLLASSSTYRKQRLNALGLSFVADSPNIDETRQDNEPPHEFVLRLAKEKAHALIERYPNHWIIASDQTAVFNGQCLGKPLSHDKAVEQLARFSGQKVTFLTSLYLQSPVKGASFSTVEPYDVVFRSLTTEHIERYVQWEKPYDCAGSFKMEGLGISLFEALNGRDPNALIGLPLMALVDGFEQLGASIFDFMETP